MDQVLFQGPLFLVCLIVMMSAVIIVHELGHYWAARWAGGAIESFAVGFGKPLIERRDRRGTRWRINMFPFGGFVSFLSRAGLEQLKKTAKPVPVGIAFEAIHPLKRIVISLAGPAANFVLALIILAAAFMTFGRQDYTVGVVGLTPGGAADQAGMMVGDEISRVGGREVFSGQDVARSILVNPNTPIKFDIERAGEMIPLTITPVEIRRENEFGQVVPQATIGVQMQDVELGAPTRYNPVQAVGQGMMQIGESIKITSTMLQRIITGRMSVHTMSGPIGIGDLTRRVVNQIWGEQSLTTYQKISLLFWRLISICAAISVGVGFFNLLPLPMLDGWNTLFYTYEAITKQVIPDLVQELSVRVGLFMLLALMAFISFGDVLETGLFGGAS